MDAPLHDGMFSGEYIMASNEYHFITHWRINAPLKQVYDTLGDPMGLVRWWCSVYLDVKQLEAGDPETGVGRVIDLYTKGWLPYTLRWKFRVTEVHPKGYSLEAMGDFVGRGIWTFEEDGDWTNITYDWKIHAEKPLLKLLSPLMKPIFKSNHEWAMKMGEESLRLELARQNAKSPEELAKIPPPPPATPTSMIGFLRRLLKR
jgi:Polyketide cyclase / dehydrase and lipid transport